jgi:hypothetical protein
VNLQCWISSNSLYFPISRSNGCKTLKICNWSFVWSVAPESATNKVKEFEEDEYAGNAKVSLLWCRLFGSSSFLEA